MFLPVLRRLYSEIRFNRLRNMDGLLAPPKAEKPSPRRLENPVSAIFRVSVGGRQPRIPGLLSIFIAFATTYESSSISQRGNLWGNDTIID